MQLERGQLFLRIRSRIDLRIHLRDLPLLVDQIRDAFGVFIFGAGGCAVREADLALGVAEQRKRELELLRELAVLVDAVEGGAEDLGVLRLVFFDEVPEPGTFSRSTRCVGLRIKPEHHFLTPEIAELRAVASVIHDVEVGGGIAGFEHRRTS